MRCHLKISFFFIPFLWCITLNAQTKKTIIGTVLDSTKTPMPYATIMLLEDVSSKLSSYGITNEKGSFILETKETGSFKLQITFIGYGDFQRKIQIKETDKQIDLGIIVLNQLTNILDEATIEAEFVPVLIKGDTVEYNADAYKIEDNSVLEDLLIKLPGIEVKDGKVKSQGKEIEKILIEGKAFFGDNPEIATKNISANIVNKVQVFDKASDYEAFTGISDGKETPTINLLLKEGKNKGFFGDADIASGLPVESYSVSGNANRFNENIQYSLIGGSNNVSQQTLSYDDYIKFSGLYEDAINDVINMSEIPTNLFDDVGITKTDLLGANFNYQTKNKSKIHFNYIYNQSDNHTSKNSSGKIFSDNDFYSNNSTGVNNSNLQNHRGKVQYQQYRDKYVFKFNSLFSLNDFTGLDTSYSNMNWESMQTKRTTYINNTTNYLNLNWNANAQLMYKLKKAGRFINIDINSNNNTNDEKKDIINNTTMYYNDTVGLLVNNNKQRDLQNSMSKYKVKLNLIEPLVNANFLDFSIINEYSNTNNNISFFDNIYNAKLKDLFNNFRKNVNQSTFQLAYKKMRKKFKISLGIDYQLLFMKNTNLVSDTTYESYFSYILPNFNYEYQLSKSKKITASLTSYINVPSISQLQDVEDNTNPAYVYIGNPSIKPGYNNLLKIHYQSFNMLFYKYKYAGIFLRRSVNQIILSSYINDEIKTVVKPINANLSINIGGYYGQQFPVWDTPFVINTETEAYYSLSDIFINDKVDKLHSSTLTNNLEIGNKKKRNIDIRLGGTIDFSLVQYNKNNTYNQNYYNYDIYNMINWKIGKTLTLNADFHYLYYSETENNNSVEYLMLNCGVSKYFFSKKLSVYLKINNLFDEKTEQIRITKSNEYHEFNRNKMGRYIFVGLKYIFRKFDE